MARGRSRATLEDGDAQERRRDTAGGGDRPDDPRGRSRCIAEYSASEWVAGN